MHALVDPEHLMTGIHLLDWSRRRWLAAGLLVMPLAAGYWSITAPLTSIPWVLVVIASAAAASLILASYVPVAGSGRIIEIGCSPCAVAAAGAVLMSFAVRSGSPHDPGLATLSLLALVFGLAQRSSDQVCSLPSAPASPAEPAHAEEPAGSADPAG